MEMLILTILAVFGLLLLLYVVLKFLASLWRLLWPYVLARPKNLRQLAGDAPWALVTGCTDGIGRAYAAELASRGFSLVLVSRTAHKLDAMEAEFRRRFTKADFVTVAFDFTEPRVEQYRQKLLRRIQHLDIGILVNNVGAMHAYPQRFHDAEGGLEKLADILTVNCYPVTLLSAFILEQMVRRGKGVIVNVSSMMSFNPTFYEALYAATKVYVNWLSAALRQEYAPQKGIIIQTLTPSLVVTNMSKMVSEKTTFYLPSAEQFARQAIRTIGHADETCGHFGHQLQNEFMVRPMPAFILNWVSKKSMLRVRQNWLKKRGNMSTL